MLCIRATHSTPHIINLYRFDLACMHMQYNEPQTGISLLCVLLHMRAILLAYVRDTKVHFRYFWVTHT